MLSASWVRRERALVNRWFHGGGVDRLVGTPHTGAPDETLFDVATEFLSALDRHGLGLDVPESSFRRSLCQALCVMRMYGIDGWSWPVRRSIYPQEWNKDLETMWSTWLYGRVLTPLFWTNIWGRIPVRGWEAEMDGWRQQMELIMPIYICRSMALFVAQGLFVDDETGGFTEVPGDETH
jgi:hypothetical protein